MRAECNAPDKNVNAKKWMESVVGCFEADIKYALDCSLEYLPYPFSDREPLKCEVLRVLEGKVADVEYSTKPIVSSKSISYSE